MELIQNFILLFTIKFKDLSGSCFPVTADVFFHYRLGGSDRAKKCRIPLTHAVTAFRKQTFTHTVTYNAGKRKFYNFHVWHLPQGSAFKPTHYVCLTAVLGWTVSTELWLYIVHIIHIYIQFFLYTHPSRRKPFRGRRNAKNNFYPLIRGYVACVYSR